MRPVAISTMGWYCRTNSRAEIACSRSADSWARAITASCIDGSKTTTRPLPRAFAEYIATSALRSRSPALSMPGRPAATPTLARTFTSRPSISKNEPIAAVSRLATRIDAFMSGVSRSSTANSSPPRRAAMSLERSTEPRRSPTATSSASPAACPRLSLTSLKSSRSTNRTIGTNPLGSRASRREATTCVNSDRLASPVSGSCRAWWCSSSLSRPSCSSDCSNRPFSSAIAVWLASVSKSLRSSGSNVLMSLRDRTREGSRPASTRRSAGRPAPCGRFAGSCHPIPRSPAGRRAGPASR